MRLPSNRSVAIAVLFAGFAGGCSDSPTSTGPAATLEVVDGESQTGTAGAELPTALEVIVKDADGHPVAGQIVNFRVTLGGGSVFGGAAITNSSGTAKERWTLGRVATDSQALEVRAVDATTGNAVVFATFHATATPGAPASVVKVAGDQQTVIAGARVSDSLVVQVEDQFGNPIQGVTVAWATAAGSGSISPTSSVTAASGFARTTWTSGTSATVTQHVSATVSAVDVTTFDVTATSGSATAVAINRAAAGARAGDDFTTQPIVDFVDANGNTDLAIAAAVTMTVSSGSTVVGTGLATAVAGRATFLHAGLLGLAGNYTLTFTATVGGAAKTVTQSIALLAGTSNRYVLSSATSVGVGGSVLVSAQLADAAGNAVAEAGHVVQWTRTGANGTFSAASTTTNAAGAATVTFTADPLIVAPIAQINATEATVSGSVSIGIVPGTAVAVWFRSQPTQGGYDITLPAIIAAIVDAYGNTVPTAAGTITLALGSGTTAVLDGTVAQATVNGVATFADVRVRGSGAGLTLQASGPSLTLATSAPFTVAATGQLSGSGDYGLLIDGSDLYGVHLTGSTSVLYSIPVHGAPAIQIGTTSWFNAYTDPEIATIGSHVLLLQSSFGGHIWGAAVSRYSKTDGTRTVAGVSGVCRSGHDLVSNGTTFFFACPEPLWDGSYKLPGIYSAGGTGSATRILTDPDTTNDHTYRLAIDANFVYYCYASGTSCTIRRIPFAGGAPTTVTTDAASIGPGWRNMIVSGGNVYWVSYTTTGNASVKRVAVTGGTPVALVSGRDYRISNLVVTGGYLYYIELGDVWRLSLADLTRSTVVVGESVKSIAFDSQSMYYSTSSAVKKIAR